MTLLSCKATTQPLPYLVVEPNISFFNSVNTDDDGGHHNEKGHKATDDEDNHDGKADPKHAERRQTLFVRTHLDIWNKLIA